MPQTVEFSPTKDQPLLVGLLIDVSGSMASSIQNRTGGSLNRLESFERSLGEVAAKAKGTGAAEQKGLIRVFAYGFGFGNLLSSFIGGMNNLPVQDILRRQSEPEAAIDLDYLADNWDDYRKHVRDQASSMFGSTPMRQGFKEVIARFDRERGRAKYLKKCVLFVLSDGEPTDVNDPSEIVALADELKAKDIELISCYVTDEDITEPRHLYGEAASAWPSGAKLMFKIASALPRPSPFEAYMIERKWALEDGGRLFTQINQSEILSEFLNVITSPLDQPRDGAVELGLLHESTGATTSSYVSENPPNEMMPPQFVESRNTRPTEPMAVDENRIYFLVTNWTFATAIILAIVGVALILVGGSADGETSFTLFGQSFKSVNVGIGAIFIAVIMVVLNVRRLFNSVDRSR